MKGKSIIEVLFFFTLFQVIFWKLQLTQCAGWRYVVGYFMILIPIYIILVTNRRIKLYGLTLNNWMYNLDVGLTYAFLTGVLINGVGFMSFWKFGLRFSEITGSLILACCEIVSLFLIIVIIRRRERTQTGSKPHLVANPRLVGVSRVTRPNSISNLLILVILLLLPVLMGLSRETHAQMLTLKIASTVVWQFFFSGFGEEIIFRGYFQSRINEEFGRPFTVLGVNFGIGLISASLLFALAHVLNPFNPFVGNFEFAWWRGFWTFFAGLALGLVREKTESIIPSGIAHGLPDAVGEAFALLFF